MMRNYNSQTEWAFPLLTREAMAEVEEESPRDAQGERISFDVLRELAEERRQLQEERTLLAAQRMQYQQCIERLTPLLQTLQNPFAGRERELMDILDSMIAGIAHKLILHEIHAKPELLGNMLMELTRLIEQKGGFLSVKLSPPDYEMLTNMQMTDDNFTAIKWHMDANLSQGDMVLQSNATEIRALLQERIQLLL